jgi:signal transduction histidine kinase
MAIWLFYLAFSFFMFPIFSLTVFGFTIPLSMLGGWFYRYRGAFITPLLAIPYNFFVLYFYEDNPESIVAMAIGCTSSTLLFSVGTAYLKISQERALELNASRKKIVEERTEDLRQLVEYLIEADGIVQQKILTSLLTGSHQFLTDMQCTSEQLVKHFEETKHPDLQQAKTIDSLIRETTIHLENLDNASLLPSSPMNFGETINSLVAKLTAISKADIEVAPNGHWNRLDAEIINHLYQIIHEALTNALRHANASKISIGIEEETDAYTVYVRNDGNPMPDEVQEGMGLSLMRYHASKIGASLSINGGLRQDTIIQCRIRRIKKGSPIIQS